jgi:hypothetical protein
MAALYCHPVKSYTIKNSVTLVQNLLEMGDLSSVQPNRKTEPTSY